MNRKTAYLLLAFALAAVGYAYGQPQKADTSIELRTIQSNSVRESASQLSRSLAGDASDETLGDDYAAMAKGLFETGDYVRAEDYFDRAAKSYNKARLREKRAEALRSLALSQERQGKFAAAISNYAAAASATRKNDFRRLNANDADRLRNRSDTKAQVRNIRDNIELSAISSDIAVRETAPMARKQMAGIMAEANEEEAAVAELEIAVEESRENPRQSIEMKEELANSLASFSQNDRALEVTKELVADAEKMNDPKMEVAQLQNLSKAYFGVDDAQQGVVSLEEAYGLAMESGQTIEAARILRELAGRYADDRGKDEALGLYADFAERLGSVIERDSSLADEKIFSTLEERISQLERERELKDELISRKNMFNYVLLGSVALIFVFLLLIIRALYSIKTKNKRIALQSLRREMNPHFLFNSLNSVNQFIAQNNELHANKYLSSYSKLMRNIMENSNRDFIPLSIELEQLGRYLELEHMRFPEKFTYSVSVDDTIDSDTVMIPNMLVQPQLENAIWHGLRYLERTGELHLGIMRDGRHIKVVVDDTGIGLTRSSELKTAHQKQHRSRGITNTSERIALLNSLYGTDISISITEKEGEQSGVIVTLTFPVMDKTMTS